MLKGGEDASRTGICVKELEDQGQQSRGSGVTLEGQMYHQKIRCITRGSGNRARGSGVRFWLEPVAHYVPIHTKNHMVASLVLVLFPLAHKKEQGVDLKQGGACRSGPASAAAPSVPRRTIVPRRAIVPSIGPGGRSSPRMH